MARQLFDLDYNYSDVVVTISDECADPWKLMPDVLRFIAAKFEGETVTSIKVSQGEAAS